jgi:hypothetical protein
LNFSDRWMLFESLAIFQLSAEQLGLGRLQGLYAAFARRAFLVG